MRNGLVASVIAVSSVVTMAACSDSTDRASNSPEPNPTQAASPIPALTNNALDVTSMARRPCELLTAQQATGFGLDLPPKQMDGLFGTLRCAWTSTTSDRRTIRTVDVSMFTDNPTLEVAYNQGQNLPFFELTDISGYPAIVTRTNADLPICTIDLKVAERQSVSIGYEGKEFSSNPQQSCEINKQVAAAVLMNLPPKS